MEFECRPADPESLRVIWQRNIDRNAGDDRWLRWRDEYIAMNADGRLRTFIVFADGQPVGEGSLIFDPSCPAVAGRPMLCDGRTTVNLNALRIEKPYRRQGHVSRLVKMMEDYARSRGYTTITIGVDACETYNRAVYAHWNYTTPILTEYEDGEEVLYYSKLL